MAGGLMWLGPAEQAEDLDVLITLVSAGGMVGLGEKCRRAVDYEAVPGCLGALRRPRPGIALQNPGILGLTWENGAGSIPRTFRDGGHTAG
ncbi:hypothetical protein [Streptosporangium vulgare]|uniref:Uncharacterized protein n=1 Tax=Streptosporangium vulgare TaxID=46190 RepID=A0ABV5TMP8_9ACTN